MVDDLLGGRFLAQLSEPELIELLGDPDGEYPGKEYRWYLGPERGLIRIDSEWLAVRIGPGGQVEDARLAFD